MPNLGLELVAGGLADPIYVSGVPGDDSRLVIMQKGGIFRTLVDGELQDAPFLDLSGQLLNQGERGALGLAFHPNYAENGLLYVHYSSNGSDGLPGNGDTVVAEFQVDPANRSVANAASRRVLLTIDQPQVNHNGGEITFGADGLLYLGFGDGGGQNDGFGGNANNTAGHAANGNGQSLQTLQGSFPRTCLGQIASCEDLADSGLTCRTAGDRCECNSVSSQPLDLTGTWTSSGSTLSLDGASWTYCRTAGSLTMRSSSNQQTFVLSH